MQEVELVLRFAAHFHLLDIGEQRETDQVLDAFLNDFVDKRSLNFAEDVWTRIEEGFEKAMRYAPLVFGEHAFRRYEGVGAKKSINRGLFETQAVCLALLDDEKLTYLSTRQEEVLDALAKETKERGQFRTALASGTGKTNATNTRLEVVGSILRRIVDDRKH